MEKLKNFNDKLRDQINSAESKSSSLQRAIEDNAEDYKQQLHDLQRKNVQLENDVKDNNKQIKDLFGQNKDLYQRLQKVNPTNKNE